MHLLPCLFAPVTYHPLVLLAQKLSKVFPGTETNMFAMNKCISAHLSNIEAYGADTH